MPQKEYKNVVLSITYKDVNDLVNILKRVGNLARSGEERKEITHRTASGFFLHQFPQNHYYQERILNNQFCHVYKSRL